MNLPFPNILLMLIDMAKVVLAALAPSPNLGLPAIEVTNIERVE